MEIWKDVKSFEGIYQVSNYGRVKSLKRERYVKAKGCMCTLKELILKQGTSKNGYKKVTLSKESKLRYVLVHQLVAVAFLNHVVNGFKLVVNHIDFDKSNNNVDNLEIVTARENSNLKHIKSSSDFVGVSWHKLKRSWSSYITINKKKIHLGSFSTEKEASNAYQKALKEII